MMQLLLFQAHFYHLTIIYEAQAHYPSLRFSPLNAPLRTSIRLTCHSCPYARDPLSNPPRQPFESRKSPFPSPSGRGSPVSSTVPGGAQTLVSQTKDANPVGSTASWTCSWHESRLDSHIAKGWAHRRH